MKYSLITRSMLVGTFLFANLAHADTGAPERAISVHELMDLCHRSDDESVRLCIAYIEGVMMGYGVGQVHGAQRQICPGVAMWDVKKVLYAFLLAVDANQKIWDQPAAAYVVAAWAKSLPCKR